MSKFFDDEVFTGIDFTKKGFTFGFYDSCTFNKCNLSELILGKSQFENCAFIECNLSLIKVNDTAFQGVTFKNCKMLGIRFDTCHDFGLKIEFEKCSLNHSVFTAKKLKDTSFIECTINDCDFSNADLSNSNFAHSDLLNTTFDTTNLSNSDFSKARNYRIDPEKNNLKKAKFSFPDVVGLLMKYDILINE